MPLDMSWKSIKIVCIKLKTALIKYTPHMPHKFNIWSLCHLAHARHLHTSFVLILVAFCAKWRHVATGKADENTSQIARYTVERVMFMSRAPDTLSASVENYLMTFLNLKRNMWVRCGKYHDDEAKYLHTQTWECQVVERW